MNIDLQIAEDLQGPVNDFAALLEPQFKGGEALIALHTLISSWLLPLHKHVNDARLNRPVCVLEF